MDEKKAQFVADVRQLIRDYQQWIRRADALCGASAGSWGALYSSILGEDDIPDAIIPDGEATKLDTLATAIGNAQTMLANYAAGIDTNFERVA
jgi:hypothetical protein